MTGGREASRLESRIPDALTGLRLVLVPVFVIVAVECAAVGVPGGWGSPAFWIVVAAGVSDVLDGHLARRWQVSSRRGALLDAVADKAFQLIVLSTITALGRPLFTTLPVWLVAAVAGRDLVLLAGWRLLPRLGRTVSVEHEVHGKIASALVFLLILGAGLGWPEPLVFPAAVLGAGASVLSAAAYVGRAVARSPA